MGCLEGSDYMEINRSIFAILRDASDPAADDALFGALESADVPTSQAIVETLLVRKTRRGLHGLIASLHLLDETVLPLVLCEVDLLFSILREAFQSRQEQTRLNALLLIRLGRIYRASYLLESALHDKSAAVREATGETLHTLANELLRVCPVANDLDELSLPDPAEIRAKMADLESHLEDRRQVVSVLEAGLATYGAHHQKCLVEAAMWFVDEMGPKFWPTLTASRSLAGQMALRIFEESHCPRLVPFGMEAIRYSQFRQPISRILEQRSDPAFLSEWVRQSWRLAQPKAARAMAAIKDLACLDNQAMDLLNIAHDAHRWAARWIIATGLSAENKIEALTRFRQCSDRVGQRAAVWSLTEWHESCATTSLRHLSSSENSDWACIALYELARRMPLEYPISQILSTDWTQNSLQLEEMPQAREMSFDRYWGEFDRFSNEEKSQFGQEMLSATASVRNRINQCLEKPDTAGRVRALRIITVLNLAEPFSDRIYQLCHDGDPQVRSAATSALAALPNATSKRILQNALHDPDTRVQANAVEAVENSGDTTISVTELLPMLGSADNRVRANAVKALLKLGVREAAETLLQMLADNDRTKRISALWLVDKMGLFTLIERISKMATNDTDIQVRERAQTLVTNLGWQETTTSTAAPREKEEKQKVAAL